MINDGEEERRQKNTLKRGEDETVKTAKEEEEEDALRRSFHTCYDPPSPLSAILSGNGPRATVSGAERRRRRGDLPLSKGSARFTEA